jgi:hypothetical protein
MVYSHFSFILDRFIISLTNYMISTINRGESQGVSSIDPYACFMRKCFL